MPRRHRLTRKISHSTKIERQQRALGLIPVYKVVLATLLPKTTVKDLNEFDTLNGFVLATNSSRVDSLLCRSSRAAYAFLRRALAREAAVVALIRHNKTLVFREQEYRTKKFPEFYLALREAYANLANEPLHVFIEFDVTKTYVLEQD